MSSIESLVQAANQGDKSARWEFFSRALKGDVIAQSRLGYCYHTGGCGFEKNYQKAVEWYRTAADSGDSAAQYNLGVCYENGSGVAKDEAEALNWYKKAATQGNNYAIVAIKRLGDIASRETLI